MITVLLYGFLGKQFGRVHRFAIGSPAEAIRALSANLPGFKKAVSQGGSYKVLRGGRDLLGEENLHDPQSPLDTLRIVPVVEGASAGARVIVGVVLLAVAAMMTGGGALAAYAAYAPMVAGMGASLLMGGIAELLYANKKAESVDKGVNKPSYAFDGAVNTVAQGNPVPVCYGKLIVGSQIISGGFSTEQL